MKKSNKDFTALEVPANLADLPRFGFTSSRATSREQSSRDDIAFNVRSPADLFEALRGGFAETEGPVAPGRRRNLLPSWTNGIIDLDPSPSSSPRKRSL